MSEKILCVFLHGFLGRGDDWKNLVEGLKEELHDKTIEFWCPNLLDGQSALGPDLDLNRWPAVFLEKLKTFQYRQCVIIGYSLGGRLAMKVVNENPDEFAGCVLLSVNPFALTDSERRQREKSDSLWAQKFLENQWQEVLDEWEGQALFCEEKTRPVRLEKNFSRQALAKAIIDWSPLNQSFRESDLKEWTLPMYWVAGEKDLKYRGIMSSAAQLTSRVELKILNDYGHRLGFDNNKELLSGLKDFIIRVCKF